jgi:uncharacterized membrane protein
VLNKNKGKYTCTVKQYCYLIRIVELLIVIHDIILLLLILQHFLFYSTSYSTALLILQHFLFYSTSYYTALLILQHFLFYSTSYSTALLILQHYLFYSTTYSTALLTLQHFLFYSTSLLLTRKCHAHSGRTGSCIPTLPLQQPTHSSEITLVSKVN